jgi:MOSC domain-containing protein YiiM
MGKIEAVCTSAKRGTAKQRVSEARLRKGFGIVGDAHAGAGRRQLSLLAKESIDRARAVIPDLDDGAFGENIVTSGIDLATLAEGDLIRLGKTVLLEVTQVGKECHTACAIGQAVGDCIMPREGLFCRVQRGGTVRAGDSVQARPICSKRRS